MPAKPIYPQTPDDRYFIVRGRLWRLANPELSSTQKEVLVKALMDARRAIAAANKIRDADAVAAARARVDAAKIALGERGPVWWTDSAPDYNRHLVKNTPYKDMV